MIRALTICAHMGSATRRRSGFARVALVVATFCLLGACSVPDDESVRIIDRDRVPYGLAAPATTTTTTSTTTSTTPSTTVPPATAPSATSTTIGPVLPSVPAIVPDPVRLYFVVDDSITEVVRVMTSKPELLDLVSMLSFGPFPGENEYRPRTAVELDDVTGVALRAGTLTVDVAAKFRELPAAEQRRAIAQLVMTFTNRGGVGQVTFTSEGRRFEVPRANGSFGAATVSRDDYASMLLAPITTTTTTTTFPPTTTTTTLPPVPPTQTPRTTRKRRSG